MKKASLLESGLILKILLILSENRDLTSKHLCS